MASKLEKALAKAEKAYNADPSNKELKKAYKAAKAALAASVAEEAAAAPAPAKQDKKRKEAADAAPSAKKTKKAPPTAEEIEELKKAVKAAKKALKADSENAALKKKFDAATSAYEKALAGETGEEEKEEEEKPAAKEESSEESEEEEEEEEKPAPAAKAPEPKAAEADVSALAGLKKKGKPADAAAPVPPAADANPKVFLRNLSWSIDDDTIKKFFEDCGEIVDIFWLTDKESGKFRGSGFVTFDSVEAATKAVAKAEQDVLGRPIGISFAAPKANDRGGNAGGARGGKGGKPKHNMSSKPMSEKPPGCMGFFVGNLPYDVDDDSMREFCSDCGELAAIRWVTNKETGEFKGCGFIDFVDAEAVDKFALKNGTEFNGRQIRIDYAKPRE